MRKPGARPDSGAAGDLSIGGVSSSGEWSGLGRGVEGGDVELGHLHHGLHGPGVLEQGGELGGYDLPGEAEPVLEPAALALAAAGGGFGPVGIDLLLGVAADDEGDGLGELEGGPAVERGEALAVELEG